MLGVTLKNEILAMYREIHDYGGDFGAPVMSSFSFDPWELYDREDLSDLERQGVKVALLAELMSIIDNSTHEEAVLSSIGRRALVLADSVVETDSPHFASALRGFVKSEKAFAHSLRPIYEEWVRSNVPD